MIITTVEAAFGGAPFLLSDKCGAVTVFYPTFKSFLIRSLSLSIRRCVSHRHSFWFYAFVNYAAFHQTANIYEKGSKMSPECINLPLEE